MRNINTEWRDLAAGLRRVEALEARFRAEWGPRLERARRKKVADERQRARTQGWAAIIAASILVHLLFALALVLRLLSVGGTTVVLVLTVVVPTILIIRGVRALRRTADASPDPVPLSADLSRQWWGAISARGSSARRSGPDLPARRLGDEGEEAFLSHLAQRLPEGYLAARGLLVARRLDADVIVVGPTGVWVYEVKHWTGEITCQEGQWRRAKTYHQPGGGLVRELETLKKPFDKQWAKEARAVREALRCGAPDRPALSEKIGGGLVFTQPGVSVSVDASCEAEVARPDYWGKVLLGSPKIPAFTMEERLRTVDVLLEWSDRLHERQEGAPPATLSSAELAELIHRDAVSRAASHLSGADRASRGPTAAVVGTPGKNERSAS